MHIENAELTPQKLKKASLISNILLSVLFVFAQVFVLFFASWSGVGRVAPYLSEGFFIILYLAMSAAAPIGIAAAWYQYAKGRYKKALFFYLIPVVTYLGGAAIWMTLEKALRN
jgi:hypothetical protein